MADENKEIDKEKDDKDKWEFEDYAFTITGILVGFLLVVPELLYSFFGISILGGSLGDVGTELADSILEQGPLSGWSINELRALSPMLFLATTAIVFIKDAVDARKSGGYKGSMFTHTFESLVEDAIYMVIITIMVYGAILTGRMYASWLAGPISWILFLFIFPLVRKKSGKYSSADIPIVLLIIFAIGVIAELITGAWIAFPMSWLIISAVTLIQTIRAGVKMIDDVFEVLYYAFSVVLMALGISLGLWVTSWIAFPVALIICWILSKFKRFKKPTEVPETADADDVSGK